MNAVNNWKNVENYINANIKAWKEIYNLTDENVQDIYDCIHGLELLGVDPSSLPDYQSICPC